MKNNTIRPEFNLGKQHKSNQLWLQLIRHQSIDLISEFYGAPRSVAIGIYDRLEKDYASQIGNTFWGLDLRYDEATQTIEKVAYRHD